MPKEITPSVSSLHSASDTARKHDEILNLQDPVMTLMMRIALFYDSSITYFRGIRSSIRFLPQLYYQKLKETGLQHGLIR